MVQGSKDLWKDQKCKVTSLWMCACVSREQKDSVDAVGALVYLLLLLLLCKQAA